MRRYFLIGFIALTALAAGCMPIDDMVNHQIIDSSWSTLPPSDQPLVWQPSTPLNWQVSAQGKNTHLSLKLGNQTVFSHLLTQEQTELKGSCLYTNANELSCLLPPSRAWLESNADQLTLEQGQVNGCFYFEDAEKSLCPDHANLDFLNSNLLEGRPEFRLTKFKQGMPSGQQQLSWQLCLPGQHSCQRQELLEFSFYP